MTKRETAHLAVTIALAVGAAIALAWGAYRFVVRGTDPRDAFFGYVFISHASVSIPAVLALLGFAVWLDWRHYRRTRSFAALTPFRVFEVVTALALLIWVNVHGI